MTAKLFFTGPAALEGTGPGDLVPLDGAEGRHAATVMRLRAGEQIQLADGAGLLARGFVAETNKDSLLVRVEQMEQSAAPALRFVLVQALAKGDRDEQAVETATELGVDAVVPWQSARSVVRWQGERGAKAHRKWEQLVLAAAKQSRRALVPAVEPVVSGKQLLARIAQADVTLLLHEDATTPMAQADLPERGEVLLVVGPEGGISPEELDQMTAAGAVPVRLGPHVLRASTAGPAALAVLGAAHRW